MWPFIYKASTPSKPKRQAQAASQGGGKIPPAASSQSIQEKWLPLSPSANCPHRDKNPEPEKGRTHAFLALQPASQENGVPRPFADPLLGVTSGGLVKVQEFGLEQRQSFQKLLEPHPCALINLSSLVLPRNHTSCYLSSPKLAKR